MQDITQYMRTRRSALSLALHDPGPDDGQLRTIVEIASRVPDHGKLAPWRFELWTPELRQRLCDELQNHLSSWEESPEREKKRQETLKLLHAPCVLTVISTAMDHPKIPVWEQHLSAGAVCMAMLIAANSLEFEAQWLTGWYVYDREIQHILGLQEGEQIAGMIHIGSSSTPKTERARPDIGSLFTVRED